MMKCYLLSGFGPVHLDYYDLKNSIMDPDAFKKQQHYYKLKNGKYALPQNLYIHDVPLLRDSVYLTENLTTATLNQILENAGISVVHVPLSQVWKNDESHFANKSIVCLSTTFIWNELMLEHVIRWINMSFNEYVLVVGGQFSTLKTTELLEKYKEIDFIIYGDGENSLPQLIHAIMQNRETLIPTIPNVMYRDANGVKATEQVELDLNELPRIEFDGSKFAIPYVSMRGCPYRCKFCAQSTTSSFRYLTAERVVADWRQYVEHNGAEYFVIADSTFFIPFHRITDILTGIRELNVRWEANMRADTPITSEFVSLLEESGCFALSLGFESMNETVLQAINKGTTPEQNRKINRYFKQSGVDTLMSFIVGFPGESSIEFDDTYQYILNEHYGHYSMYVFELESSTIPIWQEREKYNLELITEKCKKYEHMGKNWRHNGMSSDDAEILRSKTIKETRLKKNCEAIFYSWQRNYDCRYIPEGSRQLNLKIEKLIDRLIFACCDFENDMINTQIQRIIDELENYGVSVR